MSEEKKQKPTTTWDWMKRVLLVFAILGVPSIGGVAVKGIALAGEVKENTRKVNENAEARKVSDKILQQQQILTEKLNAQRVDDHELLKMVIQKQYGALNATGASPTPSPDPVSLQLERLLTKVGELLDENRKLNDQLKIANEQLAKLRSQQGD